jgi:NAD(P)-dependent dehydrogenase (short-subunit alcohol dehydrogenase family)
LSRRDLTASVALVTGASRGIGRAVALELCARGARVHTCARSPGGDLEASARALPGSLTHHRCDVSSEADVVDLARAIMASDGRLDLLVNNASVLGPMGSLSGVDAAYARVAFDVNALGTLHVLKHADPLLRVAGGGAIVNLSSSVGRQARGGWGVYSATKFALEALSGAAADELADAGVASVSLNPGGTATDMRAEAYPDEDPSTIPSAERVGPNESGRRYSSRDLFDLVGSDAPVSQWPHS